LLLAARVSTRVARGSDAGLRIIPSSHSHGLADDSKEEDLDIIVASDCLLFDPMYFIPGAGSIRN
jgi:hypothetical protein